MHCVCCAVIQYLVLTVFQILACASNSTSQNYSGDVSTLGVVSTASKITPTYRSSNTVTGSLSTVDSGCQSSIDCKANHSICVNHRCVCLHSYFPHFDPVASTWSCLHNPVGSTCCVADFTEHHLVGSVNLSSYADGTSLMEPEEVDRSSCQLGDIICKHRMGGLAVCDTAQAEYGACMCSNSKHGGGKGFYDDYEETCAPCKHGHSVNGNCSSLLDEYCVQVSDKCTSHIGYNCMYNHKCSCAPGFFYNCETRRCSPYQSHYQQVVSCPHVVQGHSFGTLSCDKRSGCWQVLGNKGITAGCVDMLIALLPHKCDITCKLEYQGYGVCEDTNIGAVCFSCTPVSAAFLFTIHSNHFILTSLLAVALTIC
ncbi:uncharacterized protein [Watersipora subatra]|uniref:uncharacterized protein n=1 Tax=Watersipora subatra TaxID=2589382 RepID=UPI00355C6DAA